MGSIIFDYVKNDSLECFVALEEPVEMNLRCNSRQQKIIAATAYGPLPIPRKVTSNTSRH